MEFDLTKLPVCASGHSFFVNTQTVFSLETLKSLEKKNDIFVIKEDYIYIYI